MLNLTDIRVKFNTSRERQSLLLSLLMSRTPTRHEGSLFPEGAAGTRGVPNIRRNVSSLSSICYSNSTAPRKFGRQKFFEKMYLYRDLIKRTTNLRYMYTRL